MKKIPDKYTGIFLYVAFGALTTVVDFFVYWLFFNIFTWPTVFSNTVAWIAGVCVAFLTNKPYVFKSHDWSWQVVWPELTKFVSCRIASWLLQTVILFVTVDLLSWNGNAMKLLTDVFVIIINYAGSKLFVFRNKN